MITPIVAAFASSLAGAPTQPPAACLPLVEVSTRVRRIVRVRPSCAGLSRIERLYSVRVENGIVCIPLRSLSGPT